MNTFDGEGNACAPLGVVGDRCCDDCDVSRVAVARANVLERDAKRFRNATAQSAVAAPIADDDDDDTAPAPDLVIQAGFTTLSVDSTDLAIAVAPTRPATPSILPPRDLVVLLDVTFSMEGAGILGLRTIMLNLDKLITQLLDKEGIAPQRHDAYRRSLNVLFLWFGYTTEPFEHDNRHLVGDDDDDTLESLFTSASTESLTAEVERVYGALKCSQNRTNIDGAVSYACDALRDRFDRYRDADRANGVVRTGSILLVTDGSPNLGEHRAELIVSRHVGASRVTPDSIPSGMAGNGPFDDSPFQQPVSVFAIGLGASMEASFLTALTQDTGFWCFAVDPVDPTTAFAKTFGVVVTSIAPKTVKVECVVHRGDAVILDTATTTHCNMGLIADTKPLDPFVVHGVLPRDLEVGDVLRCTVSVPGAGYCEVVDVLVGDAAVPVGAASGLFVRTDEVERSMRELRTLLNKPGIDGYETVRASFAHNDVALARIDATMDLVAQSMRLEDRHALRAHLQAVPTPSFMEPPSLGSSKSGCATMCAPSFHHSIEASFSQSGF